ncbi:MAG: single-stranded-DNA-specific exonuclease RecJ [Pseudomonadota bacterium]|nr:single-stranded-DNA-specific exonuclease RecJ [Pseudomonadota bacterium]
MQNLIPDPKEPLGVDCSVTGQRWVMNEIDERLAEMLVRKEGLPEAIARVLAVRGIDPSFVSDYLKPTLRRLLPDPSSLQDMDKAATRIEKSIRTGGRIAIFGDYDVDGATSTALMARFLRFVGSDPIMYVPDRMDEGYGPNPEAITRLGKSGAELVVTVDCGISSHDSLSTAKSLGMDVVVIDHHAVEFPLPDAMAIVNPKRPDDESGLEGLAAVGVVFITIVDINRRLRKAGWYGKNRPEPNLMKWVDLVALGTICDVMPLVGVNRAFASQGLKIMGQRTNPGLAALGDVARMTEAPTTYHAGFILGPRINAGGRVGQADLGARMLATDDPVEALEIARKLDAYNYERQEIEAVVFAEALAQLDKTELGPVIFVAGEGWHPGVVGIVASRLKERFNRPACVASVEDGIGRASARSVRGVDMGSIVLAAKRDGMLLEGGGHPMAAGFTFKLDKLAEVAEFIGRDILHQMETMKDTSKLEIDGVISPGGATPSFVHDLGRLAPFGVGNPEPRFVLPGVRVQRADIVGSNHVRCFIGNASGRIKAIAFRAMDNELGKLLLTPGGIPVHIVGRLRMDCWNGNETVQLMIDDAVTAWRGGE